MLENLKIGYTLAPRSVSYINESIKSLRNNGFNQHIDIFAEPGEYDIEDDNIALHINEEKLGCFKNYNNAATYLSKDSDSYILIMQDDFVVHDGIIAALDEFKGVPFGYLCLSTPFLFQGIHKMGWNKSILGWGARPALYVMHASVMADMIAHEFYQNHLNHYWLNKQVDACVSETMNRMGQDMRYHNPSLATHIGLESSVGHKDPYVGMRYDKIILY